MHQAGELTQTKKSLTHGLMSMAGIRTAAELLGLPCPDRISLLVQVEQGATYKAHGGEQKHP